MAQQLNPFSDYLPTWFDPSEFQPGNLLRYTRTDMAARTGTDYGLSHGIPSAKDDQFRIKLVLVDMQLDFIDPASEALAIGNAATNWWPAIDDTRRVTEWIFKYAPFISQIDYSLDTHLPIQIFTLLWWIMRDQNGGARMPDPFTMINSGNFASQYLPLYEADWSAEYIDELATIAKKELMLWPFHTLSGTPGHSLVPATHEAISWWSGMRRSNPTILSKGTVPKVEHYSILEPEVKIAGNNEAQLNLRFFDDISGYDAIYVAGQAKSHCVLETCESIVRYLSGNPALRHMLSRVHILMDGMSSVYHPAVDFEALCAPRYEYFRSLGVNLVTTADPVIVR